MYEGFLRERPEEIDTVRRWIGAVVHTGGWRFEDPEGVVQETLIKLLNIVRAGRVERPGAFQKFVHSVSKHTCVNELHRQRRRRSREVPETEGAEPGRDPDQGEGLERSERLDLLRYVLCRLPDGCRDLWKGIFVDRRATGDLAAELGITANNLRVRVHRCLETARRLYRDLSVLPGTAEKDPT